MRLDVSNIILLIEEPEAECYRDGILQVEGSGEMASGKAISEHVIVSCGTLRPELETLRDQKLLGTHHILFTAPGLHERPGQLESQLVRQIEKARNLSDRIVMVYGNRCFVDADNPHRDIDALIAEQGPDISRVRAANCVDMLADPEERRAIADGRDAYWLTPGWLKYWRHIFRDWDTGKANETFPKNEVAILLDGIGFYEKYTDENPEEVLAFSDWMKIPIKPYPVSLERLRQLVLEPFEDSE